MALNIYRRQIVCTIRLMSENLMSENLKIRLLIVSLHA